MSQHYYIITPKFRLCLHVLYFLTGTAYILAGQLDISWLRAFKVVPLFLLICLVVPSKQNKTSTKLMRGVVCGIAGDLVLEYWGGGELFSLGAFFFLLGHAMYNLSILDLWQLKKQHRLFHRRLWVILGTVVLLSGSFVNLATTITDKMRHDNYLMLYLMPVYLTFLTLNCINAYLLLLAEKHIDRNHFFLLLGTILFCVSDNVLGRAIFADFKILDSKKINSLVIMGTYYLGQHMLVLNAS